MMALDAASTPTSTSSSTMSQAHSQTQSILSNSRRRRAQGAFATDRGSGSLDLSSNAAATDPSSSSLEHSNTNRTDNMTAILSDNSNNPQSKKKSTNNNMSNIKIINSSQTQPISNNNISNDPASSSGKPCHAARLTLLCCQNAIRMGARTQLGLCPPGRSRRELKAVLRNRNRSSSGNRSSTSSSVATSTRRSGSAQTFLTPDIGGYFGVDKMVGLETIEKIYPAKEEEFLANFDSFDAESDEEASSGDDEELIDSPELLIHIDGPQLQHTNVNVEKKYINLMEPLFTPIGDDSALANSVNVPMSGVGGSGGKLPFNRRKIKYFDSISAQDTMTVRAYLTQEIKRSKNREVMLLARHLKRAQRNQRRRLKEKRGIVMTANELNDLDTMEVDEQQSTLALSSVSKFERNMSPALAAALVIESLQMNKLESIEGMSKCYDGIIAAGIALLEINNDPTSSSSNDSSSGAGSAAHGKRAQIMGALTPLLISCLEQPSGDVILALAKLRRMCGTARYQRRFVQRVAPGLIRPPQGAIWCLKHQNDMEPILAAAELIFDSAFDIFSKGWYDRGQLLLADTKRAETLNTVAMQLKNLSSHPEENLTLEFGHGGGAWRSNKYKSGIDPSKGAKEPLAEWEVIEVDRQIRVSISNIISMDWSRVVVSKEAALSSASFHRSRTSGKRASILLQTTQSGEMTMSPKNTSSPLSPIRQPNLKSQHTPPSFAIESGDGNNNTPSHFLASPDVQQEHTKSPIPQGSSTQNIPLSPPPPNRDIEGRLSSDNFAQASSNFFPPSEQTPPRSPTPKQKEVTAETISTGVPAAVPSLPLSPKRTKNIPNNNSISSNPKESIAVFPDSTSTSSSPVHPQFGGERDRAPLSPPPVGVGTALDSVPHRPMTSTSSVSSSISVISGITGTSSQSSHYRMLTSTAAERKRTVAACRALRAQITRFEEAFIQLHGRPPKGAAERAPLATTYAQYREWKRAIRADAACRIQALYRGASTRWMLLRSNNPQLSKVVITRAGRRAFALRNYSNQVQPSVLDELSIPTEIGDHRQESLVTNSGRGTPNIDNIDMQVQGAGQSIVPQWGDEIVRRRSGSVELTPNSPIPRPSASPIAPSSSRSSGDLTRLSLPELQARKRELKQQLKQYDMSFARRHGRMPVKAEKEPIRHLYERYNALKGHIGEMEQEGRRSSSPTAIPVLSSTSPVLAPRASVSPVGSDSDESTGRRSSNGSRKISQSSASNPTGSPAPTQDLATLKAEKSRLHQMLRSFERDFYRENQRQVQSFADIRPVASQYRRYKEIKRAIAALQRGER